MNNAKINREDLKKFALILITGFVLLSVLGFFRKKDWFLYPYAFAVAIFIINLINPLWLKPVYIFWMKLGYALGWINTRIILFIVFYFIFTPIAFMLRLFKKDNLKLKIDKGCSSYWIKRQNTKSDYEKQF